MFEKFFEQFSTVHYQLTPETETWKLAQNPNRVSKNNILKVKKKKANTEAG